MQVKPENVYLISGRVSVPPNVERRANEPVVTQRVVVAKDEISAYSWLAKKEPSFRPIGAASLRDYENAIANLRAVLNGTKTDWPLLVAS